MFSFSGAMFEFVDCIILAYCQMICILDAFILLQIVLRSILPDQYRSVPIFISDKHSVSIRPDVFWYDLHNREDLERSDSESDTRHVG